MCFPASSGRHLGSHFDPIRKWFSPSDPLLDTLNIVPSRKFSIRNNARARDLDVIFRFFRHAWLSSGSSDLKICCAIGFLESESIKVNFFRFLSQWEHTHTHAWDRQTHRQTHRHTGSIAIGRSASTDADLPIAIDPVCVCVCVSVCQIENFRKGTIFTVSSRGSDGENHFRIGSKWRPIWRPE